MAAHGSIHDDERSPALTPGEVHDRSELARHLRGSIFPADPSAILACAVEEHAPPRLVEALRRLPAGEYRNVEGVWEALGGRRDERTSEGDVEDPAGAAAPRAVIPEPPGPVPAPEPAPPSPPPVPEPPLPPEPPPPPEPLLTSEVASELEAVVAAEPSEPGDADEPAEPGDADEPAPGRIHRFGFRFAGPFRVAARAFLVDPAGAHVTVDAGTGGHLEVRYGPWRVETTLANVVGAEVTGPYAVLKTIGPPHLSLADRGLTFASNRDRGVCIRFAEPVWGIDALGVIRHPGLTVTVDDVDGLVTVLRQATEGP